MTTAIPRTTSFKKVFCFTLKCCNWVKLFGTKVGLKTCPGSMCNEGIEFQRKTRKIFIMVHVLQNTYIIVVSCCCFAQDSKEMYKELKRMCRDNVLLIKLFVW